MERTSAALTLLAAILLASCNQGRAPAPDSLEATQQQFTSDPTLATLAEIQALFADGSLTSERLIGLSRDRINAYDGEGPALNALITINDGALQTARALDEERREQGPRGPLHGIPVILKDNYDTADMVTTGGSATLANGRPVDDAAVVRRLRDAGAVIIAKANMSEFALSYGWLGYSSVIGQTKNPYNPLRDPSGSSSGSAAAIAAGYATLATGTDTAGSVRGPASVTGIVGIKPTMGLVSRDGIIPASLSFDVAGPIARSVTGAAIMLEVMAGMDAADPATAASKGQVFKAEAALDDGALDGARIGVVSAFVGANPGVDAVFADALSTFEAAGARLVEIELPEPLDNLWSVMGPVVDAEFKAQIEAYLATLPGDAPRTVGDLIELAESSAIADSSTPLNPARIQGFRDAEESGGYESDARAKSVENSIPKVRQMVLGILDGEELDALVFPTMACPASPRHDVEDPTYICEIDDPYRPCYLASTTGFPEITVPGGFTGDGLPVGISLLGRPFAEQRIVGLAYAFEQRTLARGVPRHTPSLLSSNDLL
jgi:amidase